jgi:hypothetical protein
MTSTYDTFLASKTPAVVPTGIPNFDRARLGKSPFDWQRELIGWGLELGCAALFEDCGLGKTLQELEWSRQVCLFTGGDVLILAPLAVAQQTVREGKRFGIEVNYCRSQAEVRSGITVTNYDRMDAFDASKFAGVVLDESSILKSYAGKTKRELVEKFRGTRFKLAGTATPAPNDYIELGNHSEFLGVMDSHEMLTRWFINDSMAAGNYRLKRHAEDDFWLWVASWAACIAKPSDVWSSNGQVFSDAGYELPGLEVIEHVVDAGGISKPGELFHDGKLSATTLHQEMRQTVSARAELAAQLVLAEPAEAWVLWCNANYEADALKARLPDALEVRGDQPVEEKEEKVAAFLDGSARTLISKPSILGFGLNFQHAARSAFVGLSFSYEQFYQALRREYRFGQKRVVKANVIVAKSETGIRNVIKRKQAEHHRMQQRMARAARQLRQQKRELDDYSPRVEMAIPEWLRSEGGSR